MVPPAGPLQGTAVDYCSLIQRYPSSKLRPGIGGNNVKDLRKRPPQRTSPYNAVAIRDPGLWVEAADFKHDGKAGSRLHAELVASPSAKDDLLVSAVANLELWFPAIDQSSQIGKRFGWSPCRRNWQATTRSTTG